MQYLNKYTKHLKPVVDYQNINPHVNRCLTDFYHEVNTNRISSSVISHRQYTMPDDKPFTDNYYYKLLYYISYSLGVKIMWRYVINPETFRDTKGIWIIGEKDRVDLTYDLLNYLFKTAWDYYSFLVKNNKENSKSLGYSNVRPYASKLFKNLIEYYNNLIIKLLADPFSRKSWLFLEGYIKEQYKLDYKIYRPTQRREYNNAISKKFYHKRMVS